MTTTSTLAVGRLAQGVGFRLTGKASVREGLALQRSVENLGLGRIRLDLSECSGIDSTFLGCLLRMVKVHGHAANNAFALVAPSESVVQTMKSTGTNRVLPIEPGPLAVEDGWQNLVLPEWQDNRIGTVVLGSHEALCDLDEKNRQIFGPIVEQLRREIDGKTE